MVLSPHFREALVYAAELHAAQVRKGGRIPYFAHLMAVSALVLEQGGSEDEAIAALLHDAVEDQGGIPILHAIRERFGDGVAAIVDGCTDAVTNPKPTWRPRKEKYLHHLEEASPSVLLVSCADKVHNARSLVFDYRQHGDAIWARFNGGRDETLWYYRGLTDVFGRRGPKALSLELARVVSELHQLAGVSA